ncbi:hypothetical protein ACROYT_G010045 [Oculina patagonica]
MAPPIPRADDISQSTFLDSKERDFMKWMKTPEATKISQAAKDKAWKPFLAKYPNADRTKFVAQVEFAYNHTATADIYFKAGQGHLINVFGSDSKYWSPEMKKALGVNQISGGFPQQLSPSGAKGSSLPIPAVGFHKAAPSLKKIFNSKINIFVTPDQYFTTKLREIFQKTKLKHTSGKESKRWLASPNMSYWPQQLNFAVWCATTGCGISREIFDEEHSALSLPPVVRNFYLFHVYFTIRRILFQMGGIQSVSALPGDPTFSQFDNKYDVASYKRICAEFDVDPSSDFRFTRGANHGLGDVYIWISNIGPKKTGAKYPDYDKFSDEGGAAIKGNLIQYIEPDDAAYAQADWFCPNAVGGLTHADAIRQPDLAKSVQRYQLAIDQAKVRLNLAVCPGAWLMPARMVINTESVVGYNNQLKQAVGGMKVGVNNGVNTSTKKPALKLMAGGPSKINPPNSHPSNPIHKSATAKKNSGTSAASAAETPAGKDAQSAKATKVEVNDTHEINKATVAVGAVGAAAFLYALMR